MTINSNPFSYVVHTPFYAQVAFNNSDPWMTISLSVLVGNEYLIEAVGIANHQSYITDILNLNVTYTLKLQTEDRKIDLPS